MQEITAGILMYLSTAASSRRTFSSPRAPEHSRHSVATSLHRRSRLAIAFSFGCCFSSCWYRWYRRAGFT